MWGLLFRGSQEERSRAMREFRAQCLDVGVWPYFVPLGGCQITPVLAVDEEDLREGLERLKECVRRTQAMCCSHTAGGA